jgi:hypothetical protein
MSLQSALGGLSVAIMVVAYAIYLRQAAAKGIQPHPFSWFLWGLVTGVAYLVQVAEHGGAGSWVVGLTALSCFVIGGFSLLKHRWRFHWIDWVAVGAGFMVLTYYLLARNATQSAVLATTTDVIGYVSTIRKGWVEPEKDSATSFALNSAKFVPSLFALESRSVATCLYPATLVFMNAFVAGMLLWRRRRLHASAQRSIAPSV